MLAASILVGALFGAKFVDPGDPGSTRADLVQLSTRLLFQYGDELDRRGEVLRKRGEEADAAMAKIRRELGLPTPIFGPATLEEAQERVRILGMSNIVPAKPTEGKPKK